MVVPVAIFTRLLRQRLIQRVRPISRSICPLPATWSTTCTWNWFGRLQTKMWSYLALIIPVRSCKLRRLAALACLCAASVSAQSLESLGASYRKTPNPRTRAALLRYADAHPNDKNGALALLTLGATEVDERQFGDAVKHLTAA